MVRSGPYFWCEYLLGVLFAVLLLTYSSQMHQGFQVGSKAGKNQELVGTTAQGRRTATR